jgi:hypothetical protein
LLPSYVQSTFERSTQLLVVTSPKSKCVLGDRAAVVGEQMTTEAIKAAEKLKQYGDSSYR